MDDLTPRKPSFDVERFLIGAANLKLACLRNIDAPIFEGWEVWPNGHDVLAAEDVTSDRIERPRRARKARVATSPSTEPETAATGPVSQAGGQAADRQQFMGVLFGVDAPKAWVTAFVQDPFAPSKLADKAAASKLSAKMWAGGIYRKQARYCTEDANQYVAISLFKAAPWRDSEGVEQNSPRRRKSHFERMHAVMVDDIGPKIEPEALKLPLTALVETSPGNCQGWYAVMDDADSRDAELCARLIEQMIAAGLTKDLIDPGMKGVTRYGRLPAGVNNKPGRDVWKVQLREIHPERIYTIRRIAQAYGLDLTAPAPRPASIGASAESLVTKLEKLGLKPIDKGDGKWDITCPWVKEHGDEIDSGSTYFEPDVENRNQGGFCCHHGHCRGIRDITDLREWVKEQARKTREQAKTELTRTKEFTDEELDEMDIEPIKWVVDKLVAPGLTLLAAPPKLGKSYFVLQMGLCVGAGRPFLGRQTRQVKVSYFDLEEWPGLLQEKRDLIRTGNGIGKGEARIRYAMEMSGGDVTVLEDMQRHIDEGSTLLIVDLLARVRDELNEDAKKNAYARDYAALRKFADFILQGNPHVAIVIVHHTNKGNHESLQEKISGSQGLAGATHTNLVLASLPERGLDSTTKDAARKHRRLYIESKMTPTAEEVIEMMANGGGWQTTDKTVEDVLATSKQRVILQILGAAQGERMRAEAIKAKLPEYGMRAPTLDVLHEMLVRMVRHGLIESQRGPGGGYWLPARD